MIIVTIEDIIVFIISGLFIIGMFILWIMCKIEDFKKNRKNKKRNCNNCINKKTMNCPNSSLCYETSNKPYFKELGGNK